MFLWHDDLNRKNSLLLDDFDPSYFLHVGQRLYRGEETEEDSHLAAIGLRGIYFQATEALFTLLLAYVQAPHAPFAWIADLRPSELERLVTRIRDGNGRVINPHGCRRLDFSTICDLVHEPLRGPQPAAFDELRSNLVGVWLHLSRELTGDRSEYNSLKHGLAVGMAGFAQRISREDGTPIMDEPGGTGVTFLKEKALGDRRGNVYMCWRGSNWTPAVLFGYLELISLSLGNLVSALRRYMGIGAMAEIRWLGATDGYNPHRLEDRKRKIATVAEDLQFGDDAPSWPTEDQARRAVREFYRWDDAV